MSNSSLRNVLIVPFVGLLVVTFLLTGYLAYRSGQRSVEMLANQLMAEISNRIQQTIRETMAIPPLITQTNQDALRNQHLQVDDLQAWRPYLARQSARFESVTYIYFGDEQGQYLEWQRWVDDSLEFSVKDVEVSDVVEVYATDAEGRLGPLLRVNETYDPRQRPWYQQAKTQGAPMWTSIYEFNDVPPTLGISFARPYYDEQEQLVGVLGSDFTLLQLNDFLRRLDIAQTGEAFIIERSGDLIALSTGSPPLDEANQRLAAVEADHPLVQQTARHLLQDAGSFANLTAMTTQFRDASGRYNLVQVNNFRDAYGLDWLVVVVVPEADFMVDIWLGWRYMTGIGLLALTLAILGGVWTARSITKPLLQLNRAAQAMAAGNLEQTVIANRDDEVGQLAHSFNSMAQQLRNSFEILETNEAKYRTLFEDSLDSIIITEPGGQLLDINPAGLKLFGITYAEAKQKNVADWYVDVQQRQRFLKTLLTTQAVSDFEAEMLRQDGSIIYVQFTSTLRDDGDRLTIVTLIRDVTARKQIEAELAQYQHHLEEMVAARTAELTKTNEALQQEIAERKRAEEATQQANTALQRRVEELSTLNHITQAVTMEINLEAILQIVAQEIVRSFKAYSSGIALFQADRTSLKVVADFIHDPAIETAVGVIIPVENNPSTQLILQTKKPLVIDDAQHNPLTHPIHAVMRAQNIHSLIIAPLLVRGEVIGSYSVNIADATRHFTEEEVKLIETIGGQIAGVVENARLLAQEKQQRQVAESLQEVAATLNGSLNQQTVIDRILQALRLVISYDVAHLFLQEGEHLYLAAGGEADNDVAPDQIPLAGDAAVAQVFRTHESVVVVDVSQSAAWQTALSAQFASTVSSWVASPMLAGQQPVGVLSISSQQPKRYDQWTGQTLQLFANQAAIAIRNAQLYAEIQQKNEDLAQTLEMLQATQSELVQSEKMAALGQLMAGVAHEINTPLGVIRAAIDNITETQAQTIRELPVLLHTLSETERTLLSQMLHEATTAKHVLSAKEERKVRRQLRRQLEADGIAEADNHADMLTDIGVHNNWQQYLPLLQHQQALTIVDTAYRLARQQNNSRNITISVERATKIVFALKRYSRFDHTNSKQNVDVRETLDTVLTLYSNKIKHNVEVIRHYAEVPLVPCYVDELNQVWTNLIHNALQAMDERGVLEIGVSELSMTVTTEEGGSSKQPGVLVSITDDGPGIPADIKDKIFDPFFTTKPPGEGSGLGLDISRKIIEKHNGNISVESEPKRTMFKVWLPLDTTAIEEVTNDEQ